MVIYPVLSESQCSHVEVIQSICDVSNVTLQCPVPVHGDRGRDRRASTAGQPGLASEAGRARSNGQLQPECRLHLRLQLQDECGAEGHSELLGLSGSPGGRLGLS